MAIYSHKTFFFKEKTMTEITKSEKNPKEIKEKMYTFVPPALKEQIVVLAEQTDRSPSAMVRLLVMRGLESYTANS